MRLPKAPIVPKDVANVVGRLAGMPGVVAVVLGGSRATGRATEHSDWDLGVYYRGTVDTRALAELGTVHPPGSWGRVMNGGAWLTVEGLEVDVLLRDLSVVDEWSKRAEEGDYEVDALLGYVAGVPTYSLLAERAVAMLLTGDLPPVARFPRRLVETAPPRWRFASQFSLEHARMRAKADDVVGSVGQVAKAIVEHAHSLLCARATFALNEKRIVEAAGLEAAHGLFRAIPESSADLFRWVEQAAEWMALTRE